MGVFQDGDLVDQGESSEVSELAERNIFQQHSVNPFMVQWNMT